MTKKIFYYLNEYDQPLRILGKEKPNPNRPPKTDRWLTQLWYELADLWADDRFIEKVELSKLVYLGSVKI